MPVPFVTDNYRDHIEVPINFYPAADQDKGTILFATEGLQALFTSQLGPVRAFRDMGDYLYILVGDGFYRVDTSWTATLKGTINTFGGNAWMEQNGVQVAVCDGQHLYVYNPTTDAFGRVTDPDYPGASCLTYQDGYGAFINPNTGQFYLTALYDFTSIDALDFAQAEGWPDNISAIIMDYRDLWLVGPETIEFWENTGASPFPFARIGGHGLIHQGTTAPGTVRRHDNGVKMLNQNREVVSFQGYQSTAISTPKMVREIEKYSDVSDAMAFDFAIRGHNFYGINFPSGNTTWIYDALTQTWHKRQSYQIGKDNPGRWRGNACYYWNKTQLVGDYEIGIIYKMSPDYPGDNGNKIVQVLHSQEIRNGGKPLDFSGIQILFNHGVAGIGNIISESNVVYVLDGVTYGGEEIIYGASVPSSSISDPKASLSWSDDGGRTWSNEHWRSIGKIGEYSRRCRWLRLGQTKESRIFKLTVSDAWQCDVLSVDMV